MASAELLAKIKNALVELETLRISTYVGSAKYDAATGKFSPDASDSVRVISTSFKLLTGEIVTVIHPDFVTGPFQSLRDYHKAKEDQGMAIFKANLEAVERLFEFLRKLELEK